MNEFPASPQYSEPQSPQPRFVQVSASRVKPIATYALIGVTVVFYLLQVAGQTLLGQDWVTALGIKYNDFIRQGELWRLITPVFLHASVLHIGFNMYALFIYGRGLEARFGHGRFLLLYFISAFGGNVLSFVLSPNPSLGASTAIFGLIAAEAAFLLQNRGLLGSQVNRALLSLLTVAGINLFIGFTTSGVDNFGHLGGLLGGLIFTWFGGPRFAVENYRLVDEREGHGAITGTAVALLVLIPLAALGWIFPR